MFFARVIYIGHNSERNGAGSEDFIKYFDNTLKEWPGSFLLSLLFI